METIVVVDSDRKNLDNCKRMLQPLEDQYHFIYLQYPEQAFDLIEKHKISVLVSELDMPVMSGEELFSMFEMLSPHTVKIAMSSGKNIPDTLRCINGAGVFRLILKPLLLPEDIAKPILAAIDYHGLRAEEEEKQLDLEEAIETLDSRYERLAEELKEKQENYAGIYESMRGMIMANAKLCRENLQEAEKDRLSRVFDDVLREFLKCYIFEAQNYKRYAGYLSGLFHQPVENREFHIQNRIGKDLTDEGLSQTVYTVFLLGYLTRSILGKYRAMAVIERERHFYVVKFFCDYKKPEFESDPVYREKSKYVQDALHDMVYRILTALSFKAVKGLPENPFAAKIYFNHGSEGIV